LKQVVEKTSSLLKADQQPQILAAALNVTNMLMSALVGLLEDQIPQYLNHILALSSVHDQEVLYRIRPGNSHRFSLVAWNFPE